MSCPHCGSGQLVMGLDAPPKRGTIIGTLLRLIRAAGPQGLTVEDLEKLTKLPHQSVSARVHDLNNRGDICAVGSRPNRSGKRAATWVAAMRFAHEAAS